MDHVEHFGREVAAFETAARAAQRAQPAPAVPSCPGWRVTNLVLHLGTVHRYVARVIAERLPEPPPEEEDLAWVAIPAAGPAARPGTRRAGSYGAPYMSPHSTSPATSRALRRTSRHRRVGPVP